jgi:electron transfer flavoprotein beta subunit
MKILLCASKTPDTTTKIAFTPDNKSLDSANVQYILNPYDDHALARAMDIKEKTNGHLTVIHVGDNTAEPILRRCLAIGADEAILVNAPATDALTVSQHIANAVQGQQFDLVFTGRESIDFNGSMVCEMLGELMGMPSVSFATDIQFDGGNATIKRFIDGGEETLQTKLPVVISATKELAEPRIPNMRGIMTARTKPIQNGNPAQAQSMSELVRFEPPAKKSGVKMIDVAEAGKLIDILHNEEKVI